MGRASGQDWPPSEQLLGPGQRQASGHRNPRWQPQCSGRLERRLNPGVLSSAPNTCYLGRWAHHQLRGVLTGFSPKGTSRGRQTPCPVPAPRTELGYSACRAGQHPGGPSSVRKPARHLRREGLRQAHCGGGTGGETRKLGAGWEGGH